MARSDRDSNERSHSDYSEELDEQEEFDQARMREERGINGEDEEASSNQETNTDDNSTATNETNANKTNSNDSDENIRLNQRQHKHDHHHRQVHDPPHHHHHHHERNQHRGGHIKERIKPDPTIRRAGVVRILSPPRESLSATSGRRTQSTSSKRTVATAIDEEQLHKRLVESQSDKRHQDGKQSRANSLPHSPNHRQVNRNERKPKPRLDPARPRNATKTSSSSLSSSSSSSSSSGGANKPRSPPPAAIIIPSNVAKSLSSRRPASSAITSSGGKSIDAGGLSQSVKSMSGGPLLSQEQLDYGRLLKSGEVQVLYRSPDQDTNGFDRHLKEAQAKKVAPSMKQSPIAIMSMNPTYELLNKPLITEYPSTVENLRLQNTGFSWEVKIPYQMSMTTALYGAHLNTAHRYRLDQFHCHWGISDHQGSEHTVDNRSYSAEMHFVHYNMEKYHTMSKAARHPDGLAVLSVFLEAEENHHNHAELEKIVSHLKGVTLKGEHSIIRQPIRIENLLPPNRSYWSYQGSLTTPPYYESVTWFIFKQPLKCSRSQIQRFRAIMSSLKVDPESKIKCNFRKVQPLNGRTIVSYDEPSISSGSMRAHHSSIQRAH